MVIDRGEKTMDEQITLAEHDQRKPYNKPEVTHELELETRAGSGPVGLPDPLNPSGENP